MKPPEKLDVSTMTSKAKAAALKRYKREMKEYQKQKKAETDFMLKERRKEAGGQAIRWASIQSSGDNTLTLCTMSLAQQCRLKAGQNIMDKEYVKLQIAEEAILRGINIHWTHSSNARIVAIEDRCEVVVNLNEKMGCVTNQKRTGIGNGEKEGE